MGKVKTNEGIAIPSSDKFHGEWNYTIVPMVSKRLTNPSSGEDADLLFGLLAI